MSEEPPTLDPELLEKMRRGFPLSMDRLGRFIFDGDEITHPGVVSVFRRGLDVGEHGDPIVRVGRQWTYVEPADCVFRVQRVRGEAPRPPRLTLDDGREVALDPDALWEEPGAGLRCTVPSAGSGQAMSARFTNAAQMDLDAWIEWDDETPVLVIGATRRPIAGVDPKRA